MNLDEYEALQKQQWIDIEKEKPFHLSQVLICCFHDDPESTALPDVFPRIEIARYVRPLELERDDFKDLLGLEGQTETHEGKEFMPAGFFQIDKAHYCFRYMTAKVVAWQPLPTAPDWEIVDATSKANMKKQEELSKPVVAPV